MQFSIDRLMRLMRRDWILYRKPILYGMAGVIVFLCAQVLIAVLQSDNGVLNTGEWLNWYGFFLIGGGLILTSTIFWEFKEPASRSQFLILPASHLEKVFSRWLYTLILYPLFLSLTFFVIYQATEVFSIAEPWPSTPPEFAIMGSVYLLCHSVVFLGSIVFNKYVAPKSILSTLVVFLVTVFIAVFIFRGIFHNLFDGWTQRQELRIEPNADFQMNIEENIFPILRNLVILIPMLLLTIVSYFKMKEKQV